MIAADVSLDDELRRDRDERLLRLAGLSERQSPRSSTQQALNENITKATRLDHFVYNHCCMKSHILAIMYGR